MKEEPLIEGKQLTGSEIEEIYHKWGVKLNKELEPFLKHIIKRCVEVLVNNGHISSDQIEKIAIEEIKK